MGKATGAERQVKSVTGTGSRLVVYIVTKGLCEAQWRALDAREPRNRMWFVMKASKANSVPHVYC